MKRTDTHRPKAINPAEYEYVAQEAIKIEGIGDCAWVIEERRRIQEHMAQTGGTYSSHEHGGNCMVCGSVNAMYTVLFYHRPTNTYVRMGADCARKCEMGGDFDSNAFREAVQDARLAQAGKRKAQALLDDAGLTRAWVVYTAGGFPGCAHEVTPDGPTCRCCYEWHFAHREEGIIQDIVGKLIKYGSVSDKAMGYVRTLLGQIDTRAERAAQREAERAAAADCPEGRIVITGTVLTIKTDESDFGLVTKILVQHDSGWKVWGTRPSAEYKDGQYGPCAQRGDRVEFKATVERSKTDSKFGYYKRPANGRVLSAAAVTG